MTKQRAKNNAGTIRQRANGTWECMIVISIDTNGKRKYRSFYGKTPAEVESKRDAYYQEQANPFLKAEKYTVEEWIWKWYDHILEDLKPATQEAYRYTARLIASGPLAKMMLNDVLAFDIECFLRQLKQEGYSGSMISKVRGMLSGSFKAAEANKLVERNPVALARPMRKEPQKPKACFTAEEVNLLMQFLPDTPIGWSIILLLSTGMRKQELLGLEPRHIKEDGSSITVEQAVTRIKGSAIISTPKSNDSYRTIPVPRSARHCAVALRNHCKGTYLWESPKNPGNPINPSYFDDLFRRALESVPGVRVLTPHSCRHTYVSQMQALDVPMETIQTLVGHADINMTQHYLHMQEPQRQAAIEKFAVAFSGDNTGQEDI